MKNVENDVEDIPFATVTIAELLVRQGHAARGLAMYEKLLRESPGNNDLKKRIMELAAQLGRPSPFAEEQNVDTGNTSELVRILNLWLVAIRERKEYVQRNFDFHGP